MITACCITMTELLQEKTVISCSSAHASALSSAARDSPVSSRKQSLGSAKKLENANEKNAVKREKRKMLILERKKERLSGIIPNIIK